MSSVPGQDPYATELQITPAERIGGLRVFGPLYSHLFVSIAGRPLIFLAHDVGLVFVCRNTDPHNGAEVAQLAQVECRNPFAQQLLTRLLDEDPEALDRILSGLEGQLRNWVRAQEDRLAKARRVFHEVEVVQVLLAELNARQ